MHRLIRLSALTLLAFVAACATTDEPRAIYIIEEAGDRAYEQGQYSLAASEFSEVVERRPGKLSARVALGKALLKTNQAELAREHLNAAYTIDSNNEEVIELLALSMLETGDTARLTGFLRDRADDRNDAESWMRLGRYLAAAGDDDEAERALLEAARLDNGFSVGPQLELAQFYQSIGNSAEATRRYRMALYVEPQNEMARAALRAMGHVPGPTFALEPDER
ncbi:MAG: tetratricopeptide repeat protein [Phycisphaerales bacterium]